MKDRVRDAEVACGVKAATKGELLLAVQVGVRDDNLLPVEGSSVGVSSVVMAGLLLEGFDVAPELADRF